MSDIETIQSIDYMDDGTPIHLELTINRNE